MKQDFRLCRGILEARTMDSAKAQHVTDATKMPEESRKLWMEGMEAANA